MPEEQYFSGHALGSTCLKNLLISPAVYWTESGFNPNRPSHDTRFTRRGSALHKLVLEGREKFDAKYARELLKEDYPEALVTMDDMRQALKDAGLSASGKTKADLAARVREELGAVIWDDVTAEQEASGKTILKAADYDRILIASEMIKRNPALENCFENGLPEVSVFWEDNGVPFRARFDYLRLQAIIDLKSFTNPTGKKLKQAIISNFANRHQALQVAHYFNAREKARQFIREGRVFGEVDMDWLKRLADVDDYLFTLVFYLFDENGAVVTQGKTIRRGGHIDGWASALVAQLAGTWRENYARFGSDLWVDLTPLEEITEEDLPVWLTN
jgi:hypothetical protein